MDEALLQKLLERVNMLEQHMLGFVNHHTANARQTLNLITKQQPKSGPIRCVFLVHNISAWDALAGVYEAMAEAKDFDPIVISLPHSFDHKTFSGEEEVHQGLQRAGTPHLRFNMPNSFEGLDLLKNMAPDLIFRQSQWDPDVPPAFSTIELNFARLCYVTYGFQTVEIEGGYRLNFDQQYHRFCWRFFALSKQNLELIKKHSLLQGRNAVLTGYPKFDRLLAAGKKSPHWPINSGKRHFRVLWTAHHGVNKSWLGFGMFPRVYKQMLEWARANPDIDIAFKPHPALFEGLGYGALTQAEMDAFKNEWNALSNTAFVEGGDYGPLFAASDMMISDGVSFFLEYQLFDKPLVYLDSQQHDKFNPDGEIAVKGMYHATDAAQAIAYADHFKQGGEDTLKAARQEVVREIMPFPGEAAARILDAIRTGLAEEGRTV